MELVSVGVWLALNKKGNGPGRSVLSERVVIKITLEHEHEKRAQLGVSVTLHKLLTVCLSVPEMTATTPWCI